MSLLDEFEEKKEDIEIDKSNINTEDLTKAINEVKIVARSIVKNQEENKQKLELMFDEKIKEINKSNKLFFHELKESRILSELATDTKRITNSLIADVRAERTFQAKRFKELNEYLTEHYNSLLDKLHWRERVSIVLLFVTIILVVLVSFKIKSIEKNSEIANVRYNTILSTLSKEKKFWYSEKDQRAYLTHVEEIEKLKQQEKK